MEVQNSDPGQFEKNLAYLRAIVELGEGFDLLFLSGSPIALEQVRHRLDESPIEDVELTRVHFTNPLEMAVLPERLLGLGGTSEGRRLVLVTASGTEDELRAGWTSALSMLNERRNTIVASTPHVLCLAGSAWLPILASDCAPDLWSIRTAVACFPDPPGLQYQIATQTRSSRSKANIHDAERLEHLARVLASSFRREEQSSRVSLLLRASKIRIANGDMEGARRSLSDAIELCRASEDEEARCRALALMANLHVFKGEYDEAMALQRDILERLNSIQDERGVAHMLGEIGDTLLRSGNIEEARDQHRARIQILEKLGSQMEVAQAYSALAVVDERAGKLESALRLHERVAEVFGALSDYRSLAQTYAQMAEIRRVREEFSEALSLRLRELALRKEMGDVQSQAGVVDVIATIHISMGRQDLALDAYAEVIKMAREIADEPMRIAALEKIADLQLGCSRDRASATAFAHVLRSSVHGIISYTGEISRIAQQRGMDEDGQISECLRVLEMESHILKTQIQNQSFYLGWNAIVLRQEAVDVVAIIERILRIFGPIAENRSIRFLLKSDVSTVIHVDGEAIELVLTNIIENALKYAFYGTEIQIEVRTRASHLVVSVRDLGHGLTADQEELFVPFKRYRALEPVQTIAGAGIGLFVCRVIVRSHGGTIEFSSKLIRQRSSRSRPEAHLVTFSVRLPIAPKTGPAAEE